MGDLETNLGDNTESKVVCFTLVLRISTAYRAVEVWLPQASSLNLPPRTKTRKLGEHGIPCSEIVSPGIAVSLHLGGLLVCFYRKRTVLQTHSIILRGLREACSQFASISPVFSTANCGIWRIEVSEINFAGSRPPYLC